MFSEVFKFWALWVRLLWIFSKKIICAASHFAFWQYHFPPKMPSSNFLISEQLKSMKICCLSWCVIKLVSLQQGNVGKTNVNIESLPCFIYRLDALHTFTAKPNFAQNQCQDQFLFRSDSYSVKLWLMLNDISKYTSCAAGRFWENQVWIWCHDSYHCRKLHWPLPLSVWFHTLYTGTTWFCFQNHHHLF